MGRGRAKAKQVKVARQLKYSGGGMDLDRLRAEFGVGTDRQDTDDHDPYADFANRYSVDDGDEDDQDEDGDDEDDEYADYGADDFDDEDDLDEDIDDEDELEEDDLEVDDFDDEDLDSDDLDADDSAGPDGSGGGPGRGHARAEGGAGVRVNRANGS
jgi:Protein of unknown function (DUF3073)